MKDQKTVVILAPRMTVDSKRVWKTCLDLGSRDVEIMSLAEARSLNTPAFVKPADGKIFDPKVYDTGSDLPSDQSVDLDIPILRSGIVDFRLEEK